MKTYLILIIFCFAVSAVHAQKSGVHFGIKGGLNTTWINVERISNIDSKFGFHAGVVTEFDIDNRFSIQPEVAYSQKGAEIKYDLVLVSGQVDFNLNYLDIPVALKFKVSDRFNIEVGPYAAYLLNTEVDSNEGVIPVNIEVNSDRFERWDFGGFVGASIDLDSIEVGLRYQHGFKNLSDGLASDLLLGNARNATLQIYTTLGL